MAHTPTPRAALIAPFLLMASTSGLIVSALSISSLSGLGYDAVSILGMAQLAFITGVIIVGATRGHASPRTEILCGSVLAFTALLHAILYIQSGPGHPVAESLELLYFWAWQLALLPSWQRQPFVALVSMMPSAGPPGLPWSCFSYPHIPSLQDLPPRLSTPTPTKSLRPSITRQTSKLLVSRHTLPAYRASFALGILRPRSRVSKTPTKRSVIVG